MRTFITGISLLCTCAAHSQLSHPDFEQVWFTGNGVLPAGWTAPFLGSGVTGASHSGTYALYVWNWYYSAHGWAANGLVSGTTETNSVGGEPLSWKADELHGWYKYVLDDNQGQPDSAVVRVVLKRWNDLTSSADTVGIGEKHLGPTDVYLPFTVGINDVMPGIDPDSVRVTFVSSTFGNCDPLGDALCLFLSIDDLTLSSATSVQALNARPPQLWITGDDLHMEGIPIGTPMMIIDALGRAVGSARVTAPVMSLPPLSDGLYTLSVGGRSVRFVR